MPTTKDNVLQTTLRDGEFNYNYGNDFYGLSSICRGFKRLHLAKDMFSRVIMVILKEIILASNLISSHMLLKIRATQ